MKNTIDPLSKKKKSNQAFTLSCSWYIPSFFTFFKGNPIIQSQGSTWQAQFLLKWCYLSSIHLKGLANQCVRHWLRENNIKKDFIGNYSNGNALINLINSNFNSLSGALRALGACWHLSNMNMNCMTNYKSTTNLLRSW